MKRSRTSRETRREEPVKKVLFTVVVGSLLVGGLSSGAAGALRGTAGLGPSQVNAASKACPSGSTPAKIGGSITCLRAGQRCQKRYQTAYRKYGYNCVNGRLRKRSGGGTTPPPPPPPPPPAQAGHYRGLTSQNENFEFDVTSDGAGVAKIVTGQINQGCNPPDFTLFGGGLNGGGGVTPIKSDSSFAIDETFSSFVDQDPSTEHLTITGHFTGAVAVGTMRLITAFSNNGTAYTCESGLMTWTTTRTG